MKVVVEEIESAFYADVILTLEDIELILDGQLVEGSLTCRRRMCYVGVRLQKEWDNE